VAENGVFPEGQRGCHPPLMRRETHMANGINAAVDGVQAAGARSTHHRELVQSHLA
jgi:hypothetical protein